MAGSAAHAPAGPRPVARPPSAAAGVARFTARLVRRTTLWLAFAVAAYAVIEVAGYVRAYPDAASRARLGELQDNPAVRMLQGVPHDIGTPGGFITWDAGWMLAAITGIWAMLVTGRLLRGEEEAERAELMLAAPIRADRAVLVQFLVVTAAIGTVAAALGVALAAAGTGAAGAALFALAIGGFAATFAGLAAVAAQVFEVRRRAVGVSAAVFGGLFLLRMFANGNAARGRLRWLDPFGWLDELRPYGDVRWSALALLVGLPVLLCAAAVRLRAARDARGALLTGSDRRAPRTGLLGGPAAFAWRGARGVFAGWLFGTAAYALMIGSMVRSITEFISRDPNHRKVMAKLGIDLSKITEAYIGMMGVLMGLLFVLYACWRVGAARAEESSQRAEHILVRPVTRRRWLAGHVAVTLATAAVLAVTCGSAIRVGAAMTGADVAVAGAVGAALNTLPLVVFFTGSAVLVYGVAPRAAMGVSLSAAVAAYLMELIGPALRFPGWLLDLSPFHHVPYYPSEPFAPWSAAVLTALGLLAAVLGVALFERRDLAGD